LGNSNQIISKGSFPAGEYFSIIIDRIENCKFAK